MKIIKECSASAFLAKNEEILLQKESEYNLILGLSSSLMNSSMVAEDPLFFTILNNDEIYGQAIRTNPDKPLALTYMGDRAIEKLVEYLRLNNIQLSGVVGPNDTVTQFCDVWKSDSKLGMHQGIYQLDKVIHPDTQGGRLRLANFDDFEVARMFCLGFLEDCFPREKNKEEAADKAANRNIKNETLYFWVNREDVIVSMASKNRESKNGATISWVYTPEIYRNFGYASKAVAALSQMILDDGKLFCNLFTDLLNPTSNSIYQKVGYKKIGESMHYEFTP
jgi:uncharacterized protein